jgi:hypothetical protein
MSSTDTVIFWGSSTLMHKTIIEIVWIVFALYNYRSKESFVFLPTLG